MKNPAPSIQAEPTSDPFRQQLQEAARNFKSNWFEFGELLTRVASENHFRQWGYTSFEAYCRQEIRIRKSTAVKLTNAYFFVTHEEPDLVKSVQSAAGPDLEVVNFLHKAKSDENCPPEVYDQLRNSALEKGEAGGTLNRRLREMTRSEAEEPVRQSVEQSISLVNRLQQKIKPLQSLPDHFHRYLSEMETFLRQIQNNINPEN